jgi:hypothetical protein
MKDDDWVTLTSFPDLESAEAAASKLDGIIPSEILGPLDDPVSADHLGQCFLWVPATLVEEANFALAEPAASDEELTKLALESPPPDDA